MTQRASIGLVGALALLCGVASADGAPAAQRAERPVLLGK
jgi:hypothetical protein